MDPGSALRFAALVLDDRVITGSHPLKCARIALPLCRKPSGPVGTRIPPFSNDRKPRIVRVANDEI
jgi:hypothetical protein